MFLENGPSLQRLTFDPGPVHVKSVVIKVALRQIFLQVLWNTHISITPPVLHTHI